MNQGTILGIQISRWIVIAVFAAIAAALLTAGVARGQDGGMTIEYAEKGTGPVTTFEGTDPEGMFIIWSVLASNAVTTDIDGVENADRADGDHFDISSDGVLTFDIGGDEDTPDNSVSPDFEAPRGVASLTPPLNNTYRVTVRANDAATGAEMGYRKVTVKVTDVSEDGKVTWTVDPDGAAGALTVAVLDTVNTPILQFEPGAILTASVSDGDVSGTTKTLSSGVLWQWHRTPAKNTPLTAATALDGETGNSYTVSDSAGNNDVGNYIHVMATYAAGGKAQQSAPRVSDHPVRAAKVQQNRTPAFTQATVSRSVNEGMKGLQVGGPVAATDADSDVLNYTLFGAVPDHAATGGVDAFKIDQATGR